MGLLCFIFFIGPWFALAAWIWNETGGLSMARSALLGTYDQAGRPGTKTTESGTSAPTGPGGGI